MSHWWRAHDDAVDNAKLCLLSDKQHRAWFNLMCLVSEHGGALPDIKVIALKLRMSAAKAQALVEHLIGARLFDRGEGGITPHNWGARQFKSDGTDPTGAVRQKRYRDRHRNGENNGVTLVTDKRPDTENRVTETEKKDAASAAPELPLPDAEVDLFRRGKAVLGNGAGGLIKQLLAAKDGKIPLARAAIETAATKENPREYVGAIVRGRSAEHQQVDPRL